MWHDAPDMQQHKHDVGADIQSGAAETDNVHSSTPAEMPATSAAGQDSQFGQQPDNRDTAAVPASDEAADAHAVFSDSVQLPVVKEADEADEQEPPPAGCVSVIAVPSVSAVGEDSKPNGAAEVFTEATAQAARDAGPSVGAPPATVAETQGDAQPAEQESAAADGVQDASAEPGASIELATATPMTDAAPADVVPTDVKAAATPESTTAAPSSVAAKPASVTGTAPTSAPAASTTASQVPARTGTYHTLPKGPGLGRSREFVGGDRGGFGNRPPAFGQGGRGGYGPDRSSAYGRGRGDGAAGRGGYSPYRAPGRGPVPAG